MLGKLHMVRIILLFFLFNISLLAQPFIQLTQPTTLAIESKDLGAFERSETDGSDSLLVTTTGGYMILDADSSYTAYSVAATIYDSEVTYAGSLWVYFDFNLDTLGNITDYVYI